jgi:hypothetical protein
VFIRYIPNILNTGNKIGAIKKAFSGMAKLRLGREMTKSLFDLYPIPANIINAVLNENKRILVANGVSQPRLRKILFINSPKNIRNVILIPTANTNFSVGPILFNFNI